MSIKTDGSISNRDEETTGGIKIHKLFERSSIAMRLKQNITNNGEAGGNVNLTISKFSGKSSQDIENQKKDRDDEDAALMKNLEKLNKASEQMNVGIQRQKQDADEKAKAALKKQQETQSLLETKLTVLSQEQNSTKQVLETRQVKLKQTTENTAAKKQELVTLKQLKDQMAVSMKDEQDANMIERNQKINELTSQLENFRSQAKEQRTRQQQIEQNTQEVESQRILFTMKLNQLGNELQNQTSLQHTRADYDSSIQESERLQQRLKALQNLKIQADQKTQGLSQNIQQLNAKALGFDSAIDLQKSEANRLALQEQSKQIKSENKELFDMNLTQLNKVKELQVQIQMEETKIAESTEIANLLMDQNKFERMSRNVQVEIESIEDNQRLREDTRKELQTNLKQIFEETDMHNADLEKDVTDFKSVLSKSVDEKQELEDEIRALMAKVCNKRPEELKIEQIDDDYDKLVMYKQDLENFRVKEQVLQDQLDGYGKRFQEYETQLKHQFHSESAAYITENGEIISSIQNDTKAINEKAQQIDSTLREKIAHTEEQMILLEQSRVQLSQIKASTSTLKHEVEYEKGQLNDFIDDQEGNEQLLESVVRAKKGLQSYEISIIDFVVVRKDLMDQNERLKTMTGKNIRDLLDLLDDLGKQIAQLDEALSTDQKEKCQRLIDDGLKLCDSIDNEINQLELRLKNLEQEVPKVSPNEQRAFSEEIQKIKDTLGRLKGKKNILQNSLNEIQQKGDAIVQDKDKLKDILDTLQNIQDKDLKVAEKAVDKVEEKMRVAIRQYKNDKKKECNNQIAKAESKLEDLNEVINNTQAKIDSIARECSRLQNEYDYDDQERNNDIAALRADLQKEQDKLNDLLNNRDKFKEQVDDLKRIAQDLEQNNSGPNFEITNIWQDIIDKTKQLNNNMEPQIKNSLIIGAETDQVKENLAKLKDKYKNKNDLYQQCKSKRQDKQALLDAYQQNIDDIENLLQKTKQQLDVLIPITDNKNFMNQYDAKKNEYEESKFKLEQEKKKLALLQKQLDDTSLIFDALSDDIVQSKQLSKLKDDLDKLDLDINYQSGQAKDLGKDTEELLEKCQDLYQLNKQLKEKEVDSKLTDLQIALGKADKLHKEAMEKLVKYQQLIEKALRSDDEGVVESANKLKQEAAEISSELQFIQTLKDNLRGQEQQLRSKQLKLQANRQSTVKDFDQLSSNFGSINDQAQNMVNDLVRINEDLDNRNVELGDYLTKFNSLQGMYKDFDTMLANISTQHKKQANQIQDCNFSGVQIQSVLQEMERGIPRDYKLKEGFIVKQLHELENIENKFNNFKELQKQYGNKIAQFQSAGNQALDNEALGKLILELKSLCVQIENYEIDVNAANDKLIQIRQDIHDADIPILIQIREKELTEYSKKLRKAEVGIQDLKKILLENKNLDNYKQLESYLSELDLQLQKFKENGKTFKRILGQELQLVLPNPQVLQDFDILKQTIIKVIELGDAMSDSLDDIDQFIVASSKFQNQIGGLDLLKRHKDLTEAEADHEYRLIEVQKRFDRIGKGAADCDGYTSNDEEGTFIETLLGELPEMQQKQEESFDFSEQIKKQLIQILPTIQKASQDEHDEEQSNMLLENLDEIEDQVNNNEKTVTFLEKLAEKLENHFVQMEVKKKLDKRQLELKELQNICGDFEQQLQDMKEHLINDLEKIERRKNNGDAQEMLVNEEGQKINLLEELLSVQEDLQDILGEVNDLAEQNSEIQQIRNNAAQEFGEVVLNKSPYKGQSRITNKVDVFQLLRANGWMKRKIIDMIRAMKDISRRLRDTKGRYQLARTRLQRSSKQKKIYRAVKGDLVDELFANYINMLNCPVPISRLGNNQYTFGTKKIFAKIINGKLVIRVGGGYMGIEEFMMYYGQQELQRIQKREYLMMDNDDKDIVEVNSRKAADEEDGDDSNNEQPQQRVYVKGLTQSVIDQASPKPKKNGKFDNDQQESRSTPNGKTTIVGLGDVRKALKQNLIEIKTYQDSNNISKIDIGSDSYNRHQVSQNSASRKVAAGSRAVNEELKSIEQEVANGGRPKSGLRTNASRQAFSTPGTSTQKSSQNPGSDKRSKEDNSNVSSFNHGRQLSGMGSPKPKSTSKIPTIKK